MIERYSRPEMAAHLVRPTSIPHLAGRGGRGPRGAGTRAASCRPARRRPIAADDKRRCRPGSDELEATLNHDVIAFLTARHGEGRAGGALPAFRHDLERPGGHGAGAPLRRGGACSCARGSTISRGAGRRRIEHRHTPCVGRTHGVHAEPTTFGLKLLGLATRAGPPAGAPGCSASPAWRWARYPGRSARSRTSPRTSRRTSAIGSACAPEPVATQILPRDRHAALLATLAVVPASARADRHRGPPPAPHRSARGPGVVRRRPEGLVRHAAQAQPDHLRAHRGAGAGGARLRRGGLENVALWHERDISHSSVERVILPDAFIVVDYLLRPGHVGGRRSSLVYPERMRANLKTRGRARLLATRAAGADRGGLSARGSVSPGAAQRAARVERGALVPRARARRPRDRRRAVGAEALDAASTSNTTCGTWIASSSACWAPPRRRRVGSMAKAAAPASGVAAELPLAPSIAVTGQSDAALVARLRGLNSA